MCVAPPALLPSPDARSRKRSHVLTGARGHRAGGLSRAWLPGYSGSVQPAHHRPRVPRREGFFLGWRGILSEFGEVLPITDKTPALTLKEGNTPLIEAAALSRWLGGGVQIHLKYEGLNPTGSFKDRGMVLAVAKAKEEGAETVICASTGNTSASAAAYATRAGLQCLVLIPHGKVALGKLAQALVYGARVVAVEGNFDQALAIVQELAEARPEIILVNSVNPYRLEGQKTAAYEVCRDLGDAPDYLAIPVGNAGNISAYWKGFCECFDQGRSRRRPRMLGFQAAGAAPLVEGRTVERPETIATAIRIGRPVNRERATRAVGDSGGLFAAVTDKEILEAYWALAEHEGVFAEPASAAAVAGVIQLVRRGYFPAGSRVVCVLTGNGLKDPDTAMRKGAEPLILPARLDAIESILQREPAHV